MATEIKFGTSGWRGIIGEDFTFENVRVATHGIASYLKKSQQKGSGVVIALNVAVRNRRAPDAVTPLFK